jgi:hypothetical protein
VFMYFVERLGSSLQLSYSQVVHKNRFDGHNCNRSKSVLESGFFE